MHRENKHPLGIELPQEATIPAAVQEELNRMEIGMLCRGKLGPRWSQLVCRKLKAEAEANFYCIHIGLFSFALWMINLVGHRAHEGIHSPLLFFSNMKCI